MVKITKSSKVKRSISPKRNCQAFDAEFLVMEMNIAAKAMERENAVAIPTFTSPLLAAFAERNAKMRAEIKANRK